MGFVFGGEHKTGPRCGSCLVSQIQTKARVSEIRVHCLPWLLETGVPTCHGSVFGRSFDKTSKT